MAATSKVLSAPKDVRCAIYTRKSTEEGLNQEFNSLDAQREACAAFIAIERMKAEGALKRMEMLEAHSRTIRYSARTGRPVR